MLSVKYTNDTCMHSYKLLTELKCILIYEMCIAIISVILPFDTNCINVKSKQISYVRLWVNMGM